MRALLLDFDGVLHPFDAAAFLPAGMPAAAIRGNCPQLFVHVSLLAACLSAHDDVRVVVSSSWRNFLRDDELGEVLCEVAPWYGGSVGQRFRGRNEAVRDWLQTHAVTSFRILDDEVALFPSFAPQVIRCDRTQGLSDPRALGALHAWLAQPGT